VFYGHIHTSKCKRCQRPYGGLGNSWAWLSSVRCAQHPTANQRPPPVARRAGIPFDGATIVRELDPDMLR